MLTATYFIRDYYGIATHQGARRIMSLERFDCSQIGGRVAIITDTTQNPAGQTITYSYSCSGWRICNLLPDGRFPSGVLIPQCPWSQKTGGQ